MKNAIKKDSEQAIQDKQCIVVLHDDNATRRAKDSAFSELYSRHCQQVRIHFLKRLRDEDVAEDLLMVTFQKVYEKIGSYDFSSAFSTWLYKIANNTLIDYSRKAKFEVLSLDQLQGKTSEDNDGMEFQIDSKVADPQGLMIRSEVIQEVYNAAYSLKSGKIRDLMVCRCLDGLSYKETADRLGLEDNSTLRTSVRRGMVSLEKKLKHLKQHA